MAGKRAAPALTPGSKTRPSVPAPSRAPRRRDTDGDVTSPHPGADPGSDPALAESYRILRSRLDLSGRPTLSRAVTEHVIHATADFDYVTDLVCDELALAAGIGALRRGAAGVADTPTAAGGIAAPPHTPGPRAQARPGVAPGRARCVLGGRQPARRADRDHGPGGRARPGH